MQKIIRQFLKPHLLTTNILHDTESRHARFSRNVRRAPDAEYSYGSGQTARPGGPILSGMGVSPVNHPQDARAPKATDPSTALAKTLLTAVSCI